MKGDNMKVKELLGYFKNTPKPKVSAAAFLGINPATITAWEKSGNVPVQWESHFKIKVGKISN